MAAATASFAADGRALAMNGNGKGALPCSACHGAQREGQPQAGFPRLDGLNVVYTRKQLDDFADGKRSNDIMRPIASALSADERQAVASYYSTQTAAKADEPANADAATIARGLALAAHGDWPKGFPGCDQCHGPDGQKGSPERSRDWLRKTPNTLRSNCRTGSKESAPMIRFTS